MAWKNVLSILGLWNSGVPAPVSNAAPLPVSDAGGSLTIDGTVAVSNFPAVQPVNDNGGSLTVDGTVAISGTVPVSGPLTDTQLRATPPEVAQADQTLTIPDAVTVGVADSEIVAAGSAGLREIVISLATTAVTGIHINVGAAATTNKFLVQPGTTIRLNTNQAVHALRAGAVDVTAYLIIGVPA